MATTNQPKSSSRHLAKLLVIKEERDHEDGQLNGYKWANKPGLPISVSQLQPQQTILHAKTSLLKFLTELLQTDPCVGWLVYSVGDLKEVGWTEIESGYPEHEVSVILVTKADA